MQIVLSFYWSEREAALTTLYAATSSARYDDRSYRPTTNSAAKIL